MHSKIINPAAVLLASASMVSAVGQVRVQNNCGTTVWWESVGGAENSGSLPANMDGPQDVETYQNLGGVGVSIKMSTEDLLSNSLAPITQFEYNYQTGEWGGLWYDISNINGHPFMNSGLKVTPSDASCQSIGCKAGVEFCGAVYNQPHDDTATNICAPTSDMTIQLCGVKNVSGGAPAPAPAPAPAEPAPAMTTLVTVAAAPTQTGDWSIFHHPVNWDPNYDSDSAPPARRHVHHRHHGHA